MFVETEIRVGVLTVSDTASLNPDADRSGPLIRELLQVSSSHHQPKFTCGVHAIVPDDEVEIRNIVLSWVMHGDVDWIVTTGGTGFGTRDCTPEAVKPVLDREAPGLIHLLLSSSLRHTPFAALSRPVAGILQKTLIVTLPGSVKAVKENMEALLTDGLISHAIDLIRGGSGEARHATLSSSDVSAQGRSHHRHHVHHHVHPHDHETPRPRTLFTQDTTTPVAARQRQSPFPILGFDQAIKLVLGNVNFLGKVTLPVTPSLKGHVLAENVYAAQDVPSTFTTNVDGYALRSSDAPGIYNVITSQTHLITEALPPGTIYRINTGGPLPAGADAVIMVEDTRLVSSHTGGENGADGEEKEVETLAQVPAGENIRKPGSDARKGDLVLQAGERILSSGGEIGTLAFVGRKEVSVYRKPVVAVFSTGNEIVDIQDPVPLSGNEWGGIFDTNRPSLHAALEGIGYEVLDLGIIPDKVDAHVDAIGRGLQSADILLTTGGTSMGSTDLLKPVIEQHFGGVIHFGRVAIKPGKPTTFATVASGGIEKPIFALPGNPASALVAFHIFVLPALRKLSAYPERLCQLPRIPVKLMNEMTLDFRMEFHRVTVRAGREGLKAYSTGGQRSSRVASLSGANAFVILPLRTSDSPRRLAAGTMADAVVIGEIEVDN